MANEWVNRYVYAVTSKLPEKQRAEIERELHGLIADMLEERAEGGEASKHDVEAVLQELGHPSEMADRYRGSQRYLIGPGLFASYISVLRIVCVAIAIAIGVMFGVESIVEPDQVLRHFTDGIVSLLLGLVQGFAWVTVIFGVLEYTGAQEKQAEKWKPADLPELPDVRSRISPAEPIASIIFSTLFVVLFTFSIDLLGLWRLHDGSRMVVPFFNEDVFSKFLPFIWIFYALHILNECMKLITRKWTKRTIGMEMILTIASFGFAIVIFADASVWNSGFVEQLVASGMFGPDSETYETASKVWDGATSNLLYLIGVVTAIQLISLIVKAYRHRTHIGS